MFKIKLNLYIIARTVCAPSNKAVHLLLEAFALARPLTPIIYCGVGDKIASPAVADAYIDHWRGLRRRELEALASRVAALKPSSSSSNVAKRRKSAANKTSAAPARTDEAVVDVIESVRVWLARYAALKLVIIIIIIVVVVVVVVVVVLCLSSQIETRTHSLILTTSQPRFRQLRATRHRPRRRSTMTHASRFATRCHRSRRASSTSATQCCSARIRSCSSRSRRRDDRRSRLRCFSDNIKSITCSSMRAVCERVSFCVALFNQFSIAPKTTQKTKTKAKL